MNIVNLPVDTSLLSRMVEAIESGQLREVVIARKGRPVASLVPLHAAGRPRIGIAKGRFEVPDAIDQLDDAVAVQLLGCRST